MDKAIGTETTNDSYDFHYYHSSALYEARPAGAVIRNKLKWEGAEKRHRVVATVVICVSRCRVKRLRMAKLGGERGLCKSSKLRFFQRIGYGINSLGSQRA
jgi:hypothetical protein